ncbi:Nif3-like dinuclear metal center hexameric protein, partial [Arthrospira platensis SPKY1]|nr:Nif3-like dinuclear metal center hexameric protein [Arthrospira platensis SPKY1]
MAQKLGLQHLQTLDPDAAWSERLGKTVGFGAVGQFPHPLSPTDFLARVAHQLGAKALRYSGNRTSAIERVAVCGGTAVSLLPKALAAQVDAFVTADIKYHEYFVDQPNFLQKHS